MMRGEACPACASRDVHPIYRVDGVPVQSCILLGSQKEARDFPRADIALNFCRSCGFVYNSLFEPAYVDYAATTEESQHFSGTFNRFAKRLVDEIATDYDLSDKHVLEIGCGKGDFLQSLVERTGTRALGIDPGFLADRAAEMHRNIAFRREYFSPETIEATHDFVVCRHTLEHIPQVARFMCDVSRAVDKRPGVTMFFETPDAERVLSNGAFWDIYYEHCSYFTRGSHARLFRRAGIPVTRLYLDYDDQYIIQYARIGADSAPLRSEDDLDSITELVETFPDRIEAVRREWRDFVRQRHGTGERVVLWGGGSKAVSFLTTNGLGEEVAGVIDINPHKQGMYLPGTGHEVQAPTRLMDAPPDTVIVMNAVYREEIKAHLSTMGLSPEVVALA